MTDTTRRKIMLTKFTEELASRGFYVFPTLNRQKFPTRIGRYTWDWFIQNQEQELLTAQLLQSGAATGAALCPTSSDPATLLILDMDTYGIGFEELWHSISPGEEFPKDAGLVRSASGGWHIWFSLPDDVNPDTMPAEIDFGNGMRGEVRVSGKARRLIMLPDSLVTNKHGKAGKYQMSRTIDLDKLASPPPSLLARICARKANNPRERDEATRLPTEVLHLLSLLQNMGEIEHGMMNTTISRIGQVLGRMGLPGKPSDVLMSHLWDTLSPKLDADFDQPAFRLAINSGWKTGKKNADTFSPRDKHPTVSDVREESEAIFSAVPWLCEVRDSNGKTKEWQIGFGGSAKRREEAKHITKVKDLNEVLPTLTRISHADPDTVVRSPLFIQPGWSKAFEFMLKSERGVDQLGVPPEEKFWSLLDDWARISASDNLFIETWSGKRPSSTSQAFIVWPVDEPAALVIPPGLQEILLTQVGDIPKAKGLARKHLLTKTLRGMRSGQRAWVCPLSALAQITQDIIGASYETWVAKNNT